MSKLNTFVTVHDKDGAPFTFGPDDELPKWAAKRITNPNVWEGEAPEAESDEDDDSTESAPVKPPRGGRGAGEEKWRAYAESVGIDTTDASDRDAIIALVDAHEAAAGTNAGQE